MHPGPVEPLEERRHLADSFMTPSEMGGQRNFPFSRRFQISISPEPSQTRSLILSARFERKTKTVPE